MNRKNLNAKQFRSREAHKNQKKKYKKTLRENLLGTFLASAIYNSYQFSLLVKLSIAIFYELQILRKISEHSRHDYHLG